MVKNIRKSRGLNTKGFTLIELLAVIVIIAIIFTIAIVGFNRYVNSTKEKADDISEEAIKKSAVSYASEEYLSSDYWFEDAEKMVETLCVPILELVNKGYLKKDEIVGYKNKFVLLKRDFVNKTIINEEIDGNSVCGTSSGGKVTAGIQAHVYVKSIDLKATCTPNDGTEVFGTPKYTFVISKDNKEITKVTQVSGVYTFNEPEGFDKETEYSFKTKCSYEKEGISSDFTESVETGFGDTAIEFSSNGIETNESTWYKDVTISFTSKRNSSPSFNFKVSSNTEIVDDDVNILSCGDGKEPKNCTSTVKELVKNTWYRINFSIEEEKELEKSITLRLTSSSFVYAKVGDGKDYYGSSTQITFPTTPYVVVNVSHNGFDLISKGYYGKDNEILEYNVGSWLSNPTINWTVFGGFETESYVYYGNDNGSLTTRNDYNPNYKFDSSNSTISTNDFGGTLTKIKKGGLQEIGIVVKDKKTNKQTIVKVWIDLDLIAPTMQISTLDGETYTKSKTATITISDDGGSGLYGTSEVIKYAWGTSSVACSSMSSTATITYSQGAKSTSTTININSGTGAGKIYICNSSEIKDIAGNSLGANNSESADMYLDNTGPTLTINNPSGGSWVNSNITVTLNFNDNGGSGINPSSLQWKDNANNTSYSTLSNSSTTSKSDTWSGEGNRIGTYKICDNVGNCTEASTTIKIDKNGPTEPTTMEYVFGDWSRYTRGNWTNKDVYAANTSSAKGPSGATDSLSGVAKYQISSNGSDWVDYSYSSSSSMYHFSTSGTHIRYFRACDNAGNCGSYINRIALIDKSAPTLNITNSSGGSWTSSNVTVTLNFSDSGGSGINPSSLQWKDNVSNTTYKTLSNTSTTSTKDSWSGEGDRTGTYKICDNAGNCTEKSTNVKIDKNGPTTPSITNPTNGNWTNTSFSLTLKSSDSGSGIAYYQYSYSSSASTTGSSSGSQWVTYDNSASNTFTTSAFSAERNQYVYVRACDKVGNCSDKASTMIRIDSTAPTNPTIPTISNGTLTFNGGTDPAGGVDGSYSGVSGYGYTLFNNADWSANIGTAWSVKSLDVSKLSAGTYTIYVNTKDNAGNASSTLEWRISVSGKSVSYSCATGYIYSGGYCYYTTSASSYCKSCYVDSWKDRILSNCAGQTCYYYCPSGYSMTAYGSTYKCYASVYTTSCSSCGTGYSCSSGSLSGSYCYHYGTVYTSKDCASGSSEYNELCYSIS